MTADDGTAAVHAVLSGAVQPDAAGGVGDPLAKVHWDALITTSAAINAEHERESAHVVTLDLSAPALRERLARWSFDSERLGLTQDARDKTWEWPELAYQKEQHYAFVDALLTELGRGTG